MAWPLSIVSDCVLFYLALQGKSSPIHFDTHTFHVLVTVGLGHGVYRKLHTLIGVQRAGMFDNRWANASSWTSAGDEMGISPLEIGSKNQNVWKTWIQQFNFDQIDLILATTVYSPVLYSHYTRARFTVLVSCSDQLAVHYVCSNCLQREVANCE